MCMFIVLSKWKQLYNNLHTILYYSARIIDVGHSDQRVCSITVIKLAFN